MIHIHLDTAVTRNVMGFECGTRAMFDSRHAGDETWVFIDSNVMYYQTNLPAFLVNPTYYYLSDDGLLIRNQTPGVFDFCYLIDEDGAFLKDEDGAYLKEPFAL